MDNNNTNYIKMDGEEAAFEGGAIRYTKTGKGRYDLIPGDIVQDVLTYAFKEYYKSPDYKMETSDLEIIKSAYAEDISRYFNVIIGLVNASFVVHDISDPEISDNGVLYVKTSCSQFIDGFKKMLKALAIHYENGAEKYGVDNWKKGIPVIGGDRGGSFTDSMLRHLNQYLMTEEDEPHNVSAIWNAFGALWTLKHNKEKENK